MALTPSNFVELGTPAIDFTLPDGQGSQYRLSQVADTQGLLVAFICNHCPFVKHLKTELAALAKHLQAQRIGVVAINANDVQAYPEDAPAHMWQDAQDFNYSFPYLFDAEQTIAQAYAAACTPDFFLYNGQLKLVYHGQFDDSRPGNGVPVTGDSLMQAAQALLADGPIFEAKPSIGCNIKWR